MNKQDAEKALQKMEPSFVVVGIKSDGYRGIPPSYKLEVSLAHKSGIFEILEGFEQVRIFALKEEGESDDWLKQRNQYAAEQTVKREKNLLAELKRKYEES